MFGKILFLVSLALMAMPFTSLAATPAELELKPASSSRNWTLISIPYDPPPEQLQSPSAIVIPINGKVSIRLVNETSANVTYEAIGNTNQRLLQGKSSVTLQDLKTPLLVTFKRQDGGLLTPSSPICKVTGKPCSKFPSPSLKTTNLPTTFSQKPR